MSLFKTLCIVAFAASLSVFELHSQPTDSSIPEEAKTRLDHIVGKWKFRTDYLDRNGDVSRSVNGFEEANYIIGNSVVELTTTVNGSVSKGWMFYNSEERSFQLTSVDGSGIYWKFSGGLEEYVITSDPKRRTNGREITLRFTHLEIEEDSFQAVMESSIDGGKTWWTRSRQYLERVE